MAHEAQAGLKRGEIMIGVLNRSFDNSLPQLNLAIDKSSMISLGREDSIVVLADD